MNLFWQILAALVAMVVPNIGGFLNGYFITRPNIDSWFQYLHQPPFNPPNWLFAPVWIVLYSAIGFASFLVWRTAHAPSTKVTRTAFWWSWSVYALHIAVNWLWTPVFFGWHKLMAAFVVIVILDALALINTILFWRINRCAGLLFVPYLVWLAYASYLNHGVWKLN